MKKIVLAVSIIAFLVACGSDETGIDKTEITTDLINNPNTASSKVDEDNQPFFEFVEEVIDLGL